MPKATQLALLSANDFGSVLQKGKIVGIRAGKLTVEFGKRGAVQTYVIPLAPTVVEVEAPADEPKPRGRRAKVVDDGVAPKKRGRPKKVETDDTAPKKRGRPKKVATDAVAPKKRRGTQMVTVAVFEDDDAAPTRKPGRPKKVETDDATPKKRREGKVRRKPVRNIDGDVKRKKRADKVDRPKKKATEIPWDDTDGDFDA